VSRLAIVVQRYAEQMTGGAERHARLVAELLAQKHSVDVLTSCALDYTHWKMDLQPGVSTLGGVTVRRFEHPLRNDLGRARVALRHKLRFVLRRYLRYLPTPLVLQARGKPQTDGQDFLRRQGPHCPGLLQHLSASFDRYDVVIFFTALYEPAAQGVLLWGQRSLLVPLLHDEKPMYQPIFRQVLASAGALLFNTAAERRLAQRLYGIDTTQQALAGVGIEVTTPSAQTQAQVRERWGLSGPYLVYVGRIDVAKGCQELLAAFVRLSQSHPQAKLVLIGHAVMPLPQHPQIVQTGFVSEADRDALVAGAAALVIPSRYESLSLVVLESMLLGTPVIVNGACEVLVDHVNSSQAGWAYHGVMQLRQHMQEALKLPAEQRQAMGALGTRYVQNNYRWDRVMGVYEAAIAAVQRLPRQVNQTPKLRPDSAPPAG
jgi:glycosyltransferase involved in cell wall biosynthesis